MTSAPADLLEVQAYLHAKTGQPWSSLGIIHATPQGGGYHEGEDLLVKAGTAPGPQYPGSDYSYADAPERDLLPSGRLAGGNYASAFDLGGGFPDFYRFNAFIAARMIANDPRTRDIREFIYTLDGRTVRRIDRTGKQGTTGDSSHLTHSHKSFFRDSAGRRNRDDNYLGLVKEFFGDLSPAGEDAMSALTDDEQRMLRDYVRAMYEGLPATRGNNSALWGWEVGRANREAAAAAQLAAIRSELTAIKASEAADATATAGLRVALDALAAALKAGGGSADVVAINARIDARADAIRDLVTRQHAEERADDERRHGEEMAAFRADRDAEVAGLRAELAARQPAAADAPKS